MTLEDLYRLLRAGHVQAQGVVDTIRLPLVVLDGALCVISANPSFLATFAVTREETVGHCFTTLGNGQWDRDELTVLLRDVIPKSAAVVGYEITHDFPALGKRTVLVTARRLVHPDDNSLFMLVVFEDVTEARNEAVSKDLIVAEIEHRLKNFLALVTALARQIPAKGRDAEKYRNDLLSRIEVLTNAEAGMFSATGNDFASLISSVLSPYGERIRVEAGARLLLERGQIRTLSMIFHELATNALKYGALSNDTGSVKVKWRVSEEEPRHLEFEWRECEGPKVRKPRNDGFGLRLIKSLVKLDLGGSADLKFQPDGLKATISAPVR